MAMQGLRGLGLGLGRKKTDNADAADATEEAESRDQTEGAADKPENKRKNLILAGVGVLGVIALNAGLYAGITQKIIPGAETFVGDTAEKANQPKPFHRSIDKMVVDLGPTARADFMRASFEIRMLATSSKVVDNAIPRYKTALQNYLRALDENDLQERAAVRTLMDNGQKRLEVASPDGVKIQDFLVTGLVLK